MGATAVLERPARTVQDGLSRVAALVLVRIASGAADVAAVARDTRPCAGPDRSTDSWAAEVARTLAQLRSDRLVTEHPGGLLETTGRGHEAACSFLGLAGTTGTLPAGWTALRDGPLLLRALGLVAALPKHQRAIAKVDGLRLAIVVQSFGLKLRGAPLPARVRQALALVALERAFGNSVKGALGHKTDLSPKASRLLAGQLSRDPRDFRTDARLVAALAAEAVGGKASDIASLRLGAIRKLFADGAATTDAAPSRHQPAATRGRRPARAKALQREPATAAAGSAKPDAAATAPGNALASRPDPARFAAAVLAAAAACAGGWPGNRRAFVSAVWAIVRWRHHDWCLSEIEFKSMLAEAHRTGLIVLANADLKDKRHLADIQASAIAYKNTVWHYIRVEG